MQVYTDEFGNRIVPPYTPYINRMESDLNVSIYVPESSATVGLYLWNQVDQLTGNSPAGRFIDESRNANYWWGMKPNTKVTPNPSYAALQPGVYTNPTNSYAKPNFSLPPYKRLVDIYGRK